MPLSAKRSWRLALLANQGSLPTELQPLNGGTLDIFGQHQVKRSDTFEMFASQVRGVNGASQLTGGAIDENNNVGFIFVSNGEPQGTQYVFHSATLQMGALPKLTGGTITRHIGGDVDDDIGTWSGTGGGRDDDDEDEGEGGDAGEGGEKTY